VPAQPPLPSWVIDRRRSHGRRIQLWRLHRNYTQEQLAHRTGMSVSSIQRIEAGGESRLSALLLVADALQVSIGRLLSDEPS